MVFDCAERSNTNADTALAHPWITDALQRSGDENKLLLQEKKYENKPNLTH